jgi:hypothetical protein
MGHRRPGRQARDAPAGDGGDRVRQRRVAGVAAAAEHEGRHARAFGGKLQAAGGDAIQPPNLAHDAGESAMTQPLLHGEEHGARGIDEQHAVEGEADLGQGGREEIGTFRRPQNRAVEAREDAGHHERGGGGMFQSGAGIGQFMQPAEAQAALGQMTVDGVDTEGQ